MKHYPQKITITPEQIEALKNFTFDLSHVALLQSFFDEKKLPALTHPASWAAVNMSKPLKGVESDPEGLVYSHSELLSDGATFHQLYHLASPQSPFAVLEFPDGERLLLDYKCPEVRLARKPEDFYFCLHFDKEILADSETGVEGETDFIAINIWPFGDKDLSKFHLQSQNQWFIDIMRKLNVDGFSGHHYFIENIKDLQADMPKVIEQLESYGLKYSVSMEACVLDYWGFGAERGGGIHREKEILTNHLNELTSNPKNQTNELNLKINKI